MFQVLMNGIRALAEWLESGNGTHSGMRSASTDRGSAQSRVMVRKSALARRGVSGFFESGRFILSVWIALFSLSASALTITHNGGVISGTSTNLTYAKAIWKSTEAHDSTFNSNNAVNYLLIDDVYRTGSLVITSPLKAGQKLSLYRLVGTSNNYTTQLVKTIDGPNFLLVNYVAQPGEYLVEMRFAGEDYPHVSFDFFPDGDGKSCNHLLPTTNWTCEQSWLPAHYRKDVEPWIRSQIGQIAYRIGAVGYAKELADKKVEMFDLAFDAGMAAARAYASSSQSSPGAKVDATAAAKEFLDSRLGSVTAMVLDANGIQTIGVALESLNNHLSIAAPLLRLLTGIDPKTGEPPNVVTVMLDVLDVGEKLGLDIVSIMGNSVGIISLAELEERFNETKIAWAMLQSLIQDNYGKWDGMVVSAGLTSGSNPTMNQIIDGFAAKLGYENLPLLENKYERARVNAIFQKGATELGDWVSTRRTMANPFNDADFDGVANTQDSAPNDPSIPAPTTYTLTVTSSGTGSGSIVSTTAGINCGNDCSENYTANASVTLTATPTAGGTFTGWSGGSCSGTSTTCTLTMDAAKTVTASFAPVQAADSFTPTSDFTDNSDGTVTHKLTGLTWMRCAMGQTWTGATCSGTASTYTFDQAKALTSGFAGKTDWRLPSPWELISIVDYDNYNPAINGTIFPNTSSSYPSSLFWSGSSSAYHTGAWDVDFSDGNAFGNGRSGSNRVRLVRGGQSLGTSTTPDSDFTDNGDGTVTHKKTHLTWKRCAEGQTWIGSTCSGTASSYTYDQAVALSGSFAGQSDWRTPNIQELQSILEYANYPPINTTIFPNTPSSHFWSGSPYAGNSGVGLVVDFRYGNAGAGGPSSILPVRLVRGTQTSPSVDLASGLVAYYPFDGNANDASGNGHHGTTSGGVSFVTSPVGSAASFDGTSGTKIQIPNKALNSLPSGTVAMWFKLNKSSTYSVLLDKTHTYVANYFQLLVEPNGETRVGLDYGSSSTSDPGIDWSRRAKTKATTGQWYFLVFTWDGSKWVYYFDGQLDSQFATSKVLQNFDYPVYIGAGVDYFQPLNGQVDEVRIYNRALSAAEVQQLYGAVATLASLSLTAPATLQSSGKTTLSASAAYSDSTTKTVTPTWTSSNPDVAAVSATGVLTAGSVAADTQVTLTASYTENGKTVTASKTLTIKAATVAQAPTIVTVIAGQGQATISFTAPTDNGGAAITGYTVTASPGGLTASGTASPLTVTGLSNGTAYTFTVKATNSAGASAASAASNSVTPTAPVTNGACGSAHNTALTSAPASGLCTNGTAGAVSGSGPWAWSCAGSGSGGGSTAQCNTTSAAVSGTCGSAHNTASSSAPTSSGLCATGTAGVVSGSGPWAWSCAGSSGGGTAQCTTTSAKPPVTLTPGWNLLGNGVEADIDVTQTFGDGSKFFTIWKWVTSGSAAGISYPAWAFYTPSLADGGQAYAASKGYELLAVIKGGDGFWVNAKTGFTYALPAGTPIASSSFQPEGGFRALGAGWRLMATGDNPTPTRFNDNLSLSPPAPGVIAENIKTLWAWDADRGGWYFWAPSLVNSSGLANYLSSKGYLDFTTLPSTPTGTLSPTTGFWVNMP
ncbi:DUF1566 domain-containing protein [Candidatus Symbiobacter mobilis]|uniref:Fibronectin type-III domain-containing protein n=1 Tax=Candidatus Symbiobacter mobilis CR TaxID=946483 RepID=U5N605_9BURK|nr:DUF1566 domain-containing protein [Candidatus Symbiobacter mobilis]AGX86715.1 hypothetical protein Cenrod_0604 [Candidatus Symbiobacter mobilis CR]